MQRFLFASHAGLKRRPLGMPSSTRLSRARRLNAGSAGARCTRAICVAAGCAIGVLLALSTPALASMQRRAGHDGPPRYALIDVGTLGGPQAGLNLPGVPITGQGTVLGTADTTIADSDYPNFNPFIVGVADPVLVHAFAWRDGKLTDLGALPGNNDSAVFQVNERGVGAGLSENGTLDPNTGYPAEDAVLFKNGQVVSLGTLPGGHESQALSINDLGQVAGFGSNGVPDPVSAFNWGTQTRSFIWQHGVMRDLGTLGGPDAVMTHLNARGQIAGDSYTNATPNAVTSAPTTDPFLWTDGHMRDLGTLGGTKSTTNWLNDRGEVVGQDNLAGDKSSRPFLWDGEHLRDLGTLGGSVGAANHVNNAGTVVGWTTLAGDNTAHAFLWKDGAMTDLTGAPSSQCTVASAINSRDQIVGSTCDEADALLWVGGKQYDLNILVGPSHVQLTAAVDINRQGQIVATGASDRRQPARLPPEPDQRRDAGSQHRRRRPPVGRAGPNAFPLGPRSTNPGRSLAISEPAAASTPGVTG